MDVKQIEDRLHATLVPDAAQIKVAMLIGRAFKDLDIPPDEAVNAALRNLAQRPDVETFGDIYRWRHSEIKRYGLFTS